MTGSAKDRQMLAAAWITFLAAGLFFALTTPLGEGIDEPAHFAYIQHMAQTGRPPLGRVKYLSEEMSRFLHTHPVSWSLHSLYPSLQSQDDYWTESTAEQERRDSAVRELRFLGSYVESSGESNLQYESHQPPLYYVLSAPIFSAAAHWLSFTNTFLITRLWSVLLASLVIPAVYLLAGIVFQDPAARGAVLGLVVTFPGLYPGVVRVSNDALTVALAGWFFFCFIGFLEIRQRKYFFGLCALAIAGLWTKAFFIPIVVSAGLAMIWRLAAERRHSSSHQRELVESNQEQLQSRSDGRSAVPPALCDAQTSPHQLTLVASGMSPLRGWLPCVLLLVVAPLGSLWYLENYLHTGSLTGLPETVAAKPSVASSATALLKLDWNNALSVMRSSHIWIGNGSLLGVRSWMYRVIGWAYLLLLAGTVWRKRATGPLLFSYAVFGIALAYFATQVFQQTGSSVIQGWYLTLFLPVECVLALAGARALFRNRWNWAISFLTILLLGLFIYSAVFVAMPYYAGITSHGDGGHLATYHPAVSDFSLMTHRLLRFQSLTPAALPWFCLSLMPAFCVYSLLSINGILKR